MGWGYVGCVLRGLGALGLFWVTKVGFEERGRPEAWIAAGFGVASCAGAVGAIAPIRTVARAKERARRETERSNEPWTWEPMWEKPVRGEEAAAEVVAWLEEKLTANEKS